MIKSEQKSYIFCSKIKDYFFKIKEIYVCCNFLQKVINVCSYIRPCWLEKTLEKIAVWTGLFGTLEYLEMSA